MLKIVAAIAAIFLTACAHDRTDTAYLNAKIFNGKCYGIGKTAPEIDKCRQKSDRAEYAKWQKVETDEILEIAK